MTAPDAAASQPRRSVWAPGRPVDLRATLGSLRGGGDPSYRVDRAGTVWWATPTPCGDGTLALASRPDSVHAVAWGEGAEWLLDAVPTLLGRDDHEGLASFRPRHRQVAEALRRVPGWRVPRTRRPFEACMAAVVEQKVTGLEARSAWRRILARFGRAAPGPMPLRVPPTPSTWRGLDDWQLQRAGVTPQRVRTLRAVAAAASAVERTAEARGGAADQVLRALPGVGMWTSAEVRQRAHGDADAVSFGDFHVAKDICWWLTGEVGDDDRMAELLHDYVGHRFRVQRLLELTGAHRPRRAPRLTVPAHRGY